MRQEEFDTFREILKQQSGLTLSSDKRYLLETRLEPIARRHGLNRVGELASQLRRGNRHLRDEVAEAMTTNESFFFRDTHPFTTLRDRVAPLILARRTEKRLRMWSAGCSKGQEPYSIAITLNEARSQLGGVPAEITATDLSATMIEEARTGQYTDFEVRRNVSNDIRNRYFVRENDGTWAMSPMIKRWVTFRVHNLLKGIAGGPYDVIFCRNVLIYLDVAERKPILDGFARVMADDGALFLGGAETVMGVTDRFAPMDGVDGVYTPARGPLARRQR